MRRLAQWLQMPTRSESRSLGFLRAVCPNRADKLVTYESKFAFRPAVFRPFPFDSFKVDYYHMNISTRHECRACVRLYEFSLWRLRWILQHLVGLVNRSIH